MAYPAKIREKAFNLYRKIGSTYGVGKELGIHTTTIEKWKLEDGWDEKVKNIKAKVMELESENAVAEQDKTLEEHKRIFAQYAKDDENNLKILKAFKAICIDEINKYKSKQASRAFEIKSLKDATEIMNNVIKLERLIKGDPTEYLHHTISPIDAYNSERTKHDEMLRCIKQEIEEVKNGNPK